MLNKPKIIALLLPFSLLSGCNGTTGSGNSEVGMQSKATPTSTTSAPTTEPENPTPATGNAVHVARWSRHPDVPHLLAGLESTLAIANNCLVISHKDTTPTLLIFPYGMGVWDDAKQTFTHDGKVIRIGETIKVGGGTISKPADYLKGTGKYEVPDCGISSFFLVDSID